MLLGFMIDLLLKKEPCINELYVMNKHDHFQPKFISKLTHTVEENHITHKPNVNNRWWSSSLPKYQFTPLTDTTYNFLNALLDENLIELPRIIKPKFSNGVPHNFHYEEFCNYH